MKTTPCEEPWDVTLTRISQCSNIFLYQARETGDKYVRVIGEHEQDNERWYVLNETK